MDAVEVLYEALDTELGLLIETTDTVAFRAKLYAAMRQDPALNCFTINPSRTQPATHLLIVRKRPNDLEPPAETYPEPA